jgi:hypothetical protein
VHICKRGQKGGRTHTCPPLYKTAQAIKQSGNICAAQKAPHKIYGKGKIYVCVCMVILCVCLRVLLFNCKIYDDQDIFKIMKQIVFYVCVYVQRQRSYHYKYLDPRAMYAIVEGWAILSAQLITPAMHFSACLVPRNGLFYSLIKWALRVKNKHEIYAAVVREQNAKYEFAL